MTEILKVLREYAYEHPNSAETLGTFERCRFCGETRSKLYGEEWKADIEHKTDCLYVELKGVIQRRSPPSAQEE